jgi:hypothetical protein
LIAGRALRAGLIDRLAGLALANRLVAFAALLAGFTFVASFRFEVGRALVGMLVVFY